MATQILTIQETGKAVEIQQAELVRILELRRKANTIEDELEELESGAINLLNAGASVEPGTLSAEVKVTERRNVQWKTIVERELGAGYASNVLLHTKPSLSEHLIIS